MQAKPTESQLRPLPGILLISVLKYTDHPTQISCARVCQGWHEVVVGILWYRVDDIRRLIHIFRVNDAQPYIIPDNCWTRAFHYSKHIKELVVGPHGLEDLFDAILLSMPLNSHHLFPTLDALRWQCHQPLRLALFFLPTCLSSLSIDQHAWTSPRELLLFISAVLERCPCLAYLDYSGPHNDPKSHEMAELISSRQGSSMSRQWKIEAVEFGYAVLSVKDAEMVSNPFVSIHRSEVSSTVFELSYKVNHYPISKYAGPIPNLLVLRGTAIFSRLREIYLKLEQSGPVYHTTLVNHNGMVLEVPTGTRDQVDGYGVRMLFSELANSACQIEVVVLSSPCKSSRQHITFTMFEPLLQCHSLRTFIIIHPFNVIITEEELLSLTRAWSRLQHLYLSPLAPFLPDLDRQSQWHPPSLRVICSLPRHCTQLQSLGLLVDPRVSSGRACLQPFSTLVDLTLVFIGDSFNDAEIASAIVEATLPICKISLRPSLTGSPIQPKEPAAERIEAVRRVQQNLSFWRDMRNQLRGMIISP